MPTCGGIRSIVRMHGGTDRKEIYPGYLGRSPGVDFPFRFRPEDMPLYAPSGALRAALGMLGMCSGSNDL